ncbi:hypothetical protein [Candidatus Uabimicrobium amorphum]|nr:hypothetical protein [Candidatus Uabimicrobium amorphum]
MTASAWCCGVRSINLVQAQNQVQQQQPQPAPPITQPAPAPVPEPETLAEIIKADLADFDKFGSNDQETNFDDNAVERLSEAAIREVERFEEALNLPTFAGDSDESRIDRNEKQLDIAENLAPQLQQRVLEFISDVNNDVSKFVAPENQAILANAPQSVIDSFYDQVSNLHEEFFVDLNNAIKLELQTGIDPNSVSTNTLPDGSTQQETTDNLAQIDDTNSAVPTAQRILDRLQFTQQEFLNDFKFVRESTLEEIQNIETINNDQSSEINTTPDFDGALDSTFQSPTQTNRIRLDVLNPLSLPGANFDRGTASIVSMIQDLQNRFSGSQLARDLDFFLAVFPSSQETAVQDSLEPRTDLFVNGQTTLNDLQDRELNQNDANQLADFETENTFTTSSFAIGLDGRLVGIDQSDDNPVISQSENVTRIQNGSSFNTRTFGGTPGQFESVRITVGDRTYELYDHVFTSPIVLDMDGDGKLEASNGVYLPHVYKDGRVVEFDINGDGFVDLTEWVGKNDGLLIQYDSSKPVSGAQLFGDADGFINGYEKMRSLDADENGTLEGQELSTLSVWQDKNLNAKVDAGEIQSLADLKITELKVEHDNFVSQFTIDGEERTMWDWYPSVFRVKKRK